MSKGGDHGRPLYRARGHRCRCGLGLLHQFIDGDAAPSQKECVYHPQRCESPTEFSASDATPRDLSCSCGRKSPKEYVAHGFQLYESVTGCRMLRSENRPTT